ncbi:MAG: aminoglycoside phosphotransferase family protein [Chloroflexota bacterium]
MLEKPSLSDQRIIETLQAAFAIQVKELTFLPLGADRNTAVYRALSHDNRPYFVKLRSDNFNEASVTIPRHLHSLGIQQVIPPLQTQTGELWTSLTPYRVILYPFVDGANAFEVAVTDQQRIELGTVLKQLHTAVFPPSLTQSIPHETFSAQWCTRLATVLEQIKTSRFEDRISLALATFIKSRQTDMVMLNQRAEQLAQKLQETPPPFVLCHADIHGWNMLIDQQSNFYVVDWDTLVFAPKEQDLMLVGFGFGGKGHTLADEERLFYQGYGETEISQTALAYFRYDRLIVDVVEFCDHILTTVGEGADRVWALETLQRNFEPGNTFDLACRLDRAY